MKRTLQDFLRKQGYSKIPLTLNGIGHFKVKAKINGVKGSFIVDTGASHTVIDETCGEKFKLKFSSKESKTAGGLGTSELKTKRSTGNKIKINDFEINRLPLTALSLEHVNNSLKKHGSPKIDGVIGADILKKHSAIIDYKGKAIYLK